MGDIEYNYNVIKMYKVDLHLIFQGVDMEDVSEQIVEMLAYARKRRGGSFPCERSAGHMDFVPWHSEADWIDATSS